MQGAAQATHSVRAELVAITATRANQLVAMVVALVCRKASAVAVADTASLADRKLAQATVVTHMATSSLSRWQGARVAPVVILTCSTAQVVAVAVVVQFRFTRTFSAV
jgi:hypothetical protein